MSDYNVEFGHWDQDSGSFYMPYSPPSNPLDHLFTSSPLSPTAPTVRHSVSPLGLNLAALPETSGQVLEDWQLTPSPTSSFSRHWREIAYPSQTITSPSPFVEEVLTLEPIGQVGSTPADITPELCYLPLTDPPTALEEQILL